MEPSRYAQFIFITIGAFALLLFTVAMIGGLLIAAFSKGIKLWYQTRVEMRKARVQAKLDQRSAATLVKQVTELRLTLANIHDVVDKYPDIESLIAQEVRDELRQHRVRTK